MKTIPKGFLRKKTKAMKTKNNVQKALLRSAAVVVSFVLISITVSAQDFWKKLLTSSSINEIALAMTESSKENDSANLPSESFDYSILKNEWDPVLELEDWMMNEKEFAVSSFQLKEETDTELELENWMTDKNLFEVLTKNDPSLELESWMTSELVWKI